MSDFGYKTPANEAGFEWLAGCEPLDGADSSMQRGRWLQQFLLDVGNDATDIGFALENGDFHGENGLSTRKNGFSTGGKWALYRKCCGVCGLGWLLGKEKWGLVQVWTSSLQGKIRVCAAVKELFAGRKILSAAMRDCCEGSIVVCSAVKGFFAGKNVSCSASSHWIKKDHG